MTKSKTKEVKKDLKPKVEVRETITRHYVHKDTGDFLGTFVSLKKGNKVYEPKVIPDDAIEVDSTPEYHDQVYDFKNNTWLASPDDGAEWQNLRGERTALLAETDWTQLNDCPLTEKQIAKYTAYRQKLRDVTKDFDTPKEAMAFLKKGM